MQEMPQTGTIQYSHAALLMVVAQTHQSLSAKYILAVLALMLVIVDQSTVAIIGIRRISPVRIVRTRLNRMGWTQEEEEEKEEE